MKKLFLFLIMAITAMCAAAQSRNIRVLSDSGSFISDIRFTTQDTTTPHRSAYRLYKNNMQLYVYGQHVYLTDGMGNKTSFNLTGGAYGDSVTTGSGMAFTINKGDGGAKALASYLEGMLRTGYKYYELHKIGTATTYRNIKTGKGQLGGFTIDSVGTGTGGNLATISLWDGADSSTGTLIGTWSTSALQNITFPSGLKFEKGLTVKPRGTLVGRYTFLYY